MHSLFADAPFSTYLASRENLCINDEVIKSSKRTKVPINTICKSYCAQKKCGYEQNGINPISAKDFEDLI